MHRTRISIKGVGAIVALVAVAALTGCFGNPVEQLVEDAAENQAQEVIESIAEGSGVDLEVGGELPADFPAEVPLIDAPISVATAQETDSIRMWALGMTPDDVPAAMQEARQMLLDAGYSEDMWSETGMLQGQFANGTYSVGIMAMEDTVAYNVILQR